MEIIHFNEDSLKDVLGTKKTVLIDFFATWCGPCKMLSPILDEIAQGLNNENIVIGKVDVDENFDIAKSYGIMSVPTLVLCKNGEEVERSIGLKSKTAILEMLKK